MWTYEERFGWDDPIPEKFSNHLHHWHERLENLELLTVPRCFRFQRYRWTQHHPHISTDASKKGFRALGYIRFFFEDQSINVSFIMAKTHVTPVKGLVIPRLELKAAVECLNIALMTCWELEIDLLEVTFYMNSQTVLRWIHSLTCQFEVFVNNRIGKIFRNTNRRLWRHVSGVNNPVNLFSRGIDPKNIDELIKFQEVQ